MYVKRHSITSYGGNNLIKLTGFEQVVTDGNATYYAIDYYNSRIVKFNQYWEYQNYQNLPFAYSYSTKFVNGSFYFTSHDYFYKTDSNFEMIDSYRMKGASYGRFIFDSISSTFYVSSFSFERIDIFNTSCSFLQSIEISVQSYGIALFKGMIYTSGVRTSLVSVIKNGKVTKVFRTIGDGIVAITVDSFGYLAISCIASKVISVYDSNGNFMNTQITSSQYPGITAIDSNGRYIIVTSDSLDIYY